MLRSRRSGSLYLGSSGQYLPAGQGLQSLGLVLPRPITLVPGKKVWISYHGYHSYQDYYGYHD